MRRVPQHPPGVVAVPVPRRDCAVCRQHPWAQPRLPPKGQSVDRDAFVDLLNEDLELEYQSIVQYVQHIASVKGAEYLSTLEELAVHVKQELDHALTLARQIDFLGGVPSTRVPEVAT